MREEVRTLYSRLCELPFPSLGGQVGDFPLYDALIAGLADQCAKGKRVEESVPAPDHETASFVEQLRAKPALNADEQQFIDYFDILEALRQALERHIRRVQPDTY